MKYTFGEFLALKRKEKNLTQKELANMLFVSESTVGKWEQNRANPDITVLPTLSEILGVSEHELITASIDSESRANTVKAKKWTNLVFGWNLAFIIAYGAAILTCFIVNLAVNHTLSWFWIVLFSVLLASTITILPSYVKKFKLVTITAAFLVSLLVLLAVCCAFTNGKWFWLSVLPTLLAFIMVFFPIFVSVYPFPKFIKSHNALISVILDFVLLVIMLCVIEGYTVAYGFATKKWLIELGLPISVVGFIVTVVMVLILRYLKVGKFIKTGLTLFEWAVAVPVINVWIDCLAADFLGMAKPTDFLPNFSVWTGNYIENNVMCICFLSIVSCAVVFLTVGIMLSIIEKKREE